MVQEAQHTQAARVEERVVETSIPRIVSKHYSMCFLVQMKHDCAWQWLQLLTIQMPLGTNGRLR